MFKTTCSDSTARPSSFPNDRPKTFWTKEEKAARTLRIIANYSCDTHDPYDLIRAATAKANGVCS